MGSGGVDYEKLGVYLRVLGVPNRLHLLRRLQTPRTVAEIILFSPRKAGPEASRRPISRQAVESHLQQLEDLGLVQSHRSERNGRAVFEYVVDHARLFVVADELRRLALLRPAIAGATAMPSTASLNQMLEVPQGPCLVVANGPMEGTIFPLAGPGPWTIGRTAPAGITLGYDPFVSKANAVIERQPGRFVITDRPGSRNGTRVNWRRLAKDERVPLAPGDAIGVGRSLLFARGV